LTSVSPRDRITLKDSYYAAFVYIVGGRDIKNANYPNLQR